MDNWKYFFDNIYLKVYSESKLDEEATQEVEKIIKLLRPSPGASILDLGCGYGRHANNLSRLGYKVTGIDFSKALLAKAQENNPPENPVVYIESDFRNFKLNTQFDIVLNLFTSFVYFVEDLETLQILKNIEKVMKPRSIFLLETINREWLWYQINTSPQIEKILDDIIEVQETIREGETSIINQKRILKDKNSKATIQEFQFTMKMRSINEMETLLSQSGLKIRNIYGDYDGNKLTSESRRSVFLIVKKMNSNS